MMVTSLSQNGRIYPSFGDAMAFVQPLSSDGSSSGPVILVTSTDLTTILTPHLAGLRATLDLDVTTAWSFDMPTVRSAQADAAHDLNTDYFVYLHIHV